MTQDELIAAVAANPHNYYDELRKQGDLHFDGLCQQMFGKIQQGFAAAKDIIGLFGEELAIFRAMEYEMYTDKITPESLEAYLGKLSAFRERVRAEQAERNALAAQGKK